MLFNSHQAAGAQMAEVDGWELPDVFSSVAAEYAAAHSGAVVYDSSPQGRLRLTGSTRLDFLHRMSTNDMNALKPGQGAATILTTPNARMIDRVLVYVREDDLLALTSRGAQEVVARWLRKYIFFNDDVQVRAASGEFGLLSIYGRDAAQVVSRIAGGDVSDLALHHWRSAGDELIVARTDAIAGDGFHVWSVGPDGLPALWPAAIGAGATPIGEQALEVLRIESGRPRYGRELSEAYIPLEAGLWSDVSFSKGCYTGQEIIARMESRHRLAKQMVGLRAAGSVDRNADIRIDGVLVGKVTSAAARPGGETIMLGFVKPSHATPGERVAVGDGPAIEAEVTALPMA